jgi:hypothetical protein
MECEYFRRVCFRSGPAGHAEDDSARYLPVLGPCRRIRAMSSLETEMLGISHAEVGELMEN